MGNGFVLQQDNGNIHVVKKSERIDLSGRKNYPRLTSKNLKFKFNKEFMFRTGKKNMRRRESKINEKRRNE